MENSKIFKMSFAAVYPLYIQKAEKKGRTKEEVDTVICWLTGHNQQALMQQLDKNPDIETFFTEAPEINKNASKFTGTICGYRVEEYGVRSVKRIRHFLPARP